MFKKISIKYKIIIVTLAITIPSVFLSSIFILYINLESFKQEVVETSIMDAKLINELIAAPMAFNYQNQVYESLEKLSSKENIMSLTVLDNEHNIFSQYARDSIILIETELVTSINHHIIKFINDKLYIDYPIYFETEKYGNLILNIKTGISKYKQRSFTYIFIIAIILTIIAFILISTLQKIITAPILKLAQISAQVTHNQNYNIKVETSSKDEIGILYTQYQKMLNSLLSKEKENDRIVKILKKSQQTLLKTQSIAGIGSWERDLINNKVTWSTEEYNIFNLDKNTSLNFDIIVKKIYEEDRAIFLSNWNNAIKNNKEYNIEFRYESSSGIKWLHERAEFIFDKNNNAIKAFGYTYDITKRKEQEYEIIKHRNNLEDIVRSRTNEIIQLYADIAIKNEELSKVNIALGNEKIKVEKQSDKIYNTNNSLIKKTSELENTLTKLKSAQSQLVQQEKMASLGTLTAGIAHEINNPINFISSNMMGLESLVEDLTDDSLRIQEDKTEIEIKSEIEEHVSNINLLIGNINIGINRTVEIIKSLRTFSRGTEENFSNADINENIDSTLLLLKNQHKGKIEIIKNYGDIPFIFCSIGKINQVFMNLIVNAIQAIEDSGTIEIKTYIENEYLVVEIKDSGQGIPEELQDKIFEPFFTTKEIGKGTGLGLAISYTIIKNHKGQIKLISEIGKGTSFFVFLPIK